MTNDLFFTLLLYRKAKTRQYRFYSRLVAHDMAYIDINRFVEPTDTLTITYKISSADALEDKNRPYVVGGQPTQQFILCARMGYVDENNITHQDTNLILLSPYPTWGSKLATWDGTYHCVLGNGASDELGNAHYVDIGDNGFDKKVTVGFHPDKIDYYVHNTEQAIELTNRGRKLTEGFNRAYIKLFAGFYWSTAKLVMNGCDSSIYSFYIQDANEQYTMRLQPAEDLSTGELGMYDSINDKFYPNKNSVGYFTVEEDITDKIVLDVESQIDTKRYNILCTSYNLPYQLNNDKLVLVKKHDLPPITEGFIDLWNGMGKQSDEVGIFNNVTLQRNDTGDVTYTDNGDGSITVNAPKIPGHGYDYTRWAYLLPNIAVGSMVIVGKCNGGFVIMNYEGDTVNVWGSFRWFDEGRTQNNITEDYADADYSSIYTAENPHTYTASGNSAIAEGGTLFGVQYIRECNITIYGMALYSTILTKAQLLEVAHWLDRYVKRPQAATRSTEENS